MQFKDLGNVIVLKSADDNRSNIQGDRLEAEILSGMAELLQYITGASLPVFHGGPGRNGHEDEYGGCLADRLLAEGGPGQRGAPVIFSK